MSPRDIRFMEGTRKLAEELEPSAKEAAEWAAEYKRYQNPACYVLDDGEQVSPKNAEKELKALNTALKRWVEANGDLEVEGLGTLTIQYPQSEKVDLISLAEREPETVARLLKLGCLEVNMAALVAQEKAGMVAANIPRMKIGGSARLVWSRDA